MNVAPFLRWSAASLISVFAATLPVHAALAEEDGMSQDSKSGDSAKDSKSEHASKKSERKSPKKKEKTASKAKPKAVAKEPKKKPVAKASAKKEKPAKKDAPLAKGAKMDDAKAAPPAEPAKDEHKTTRLRKKVHRHEKK